MNFPERFFWCFLLIIYVYNVNAQTTYEQIIFSEDFETTKDGKPTIRDAYNWSELFQDSVLLSTPKDGSGTNTLLVDSEQMTNAIQFKLPLSESIIYILSWDMFIAGDKIPKNAFFDGGENFDRIQFPTTKSNFEFNKWLKVTCLIDSNPFKIIKKGNPRYWGTYEYRTEEGNIVIKNRELKNYFTEILPNHTTGFNISADIVDYYIDNIQLKEVGNINDALTLQCPIRVDSMINFRAFAQMRKEQTLPAHINFEKDAVQIIVEEQPDNCHLNLYISNQTQKAIHGQINGLYREAKNENGEWMPIENVYEPYPSGTFVCGGGVTAAQLSLGESYQILKIPKYNGDFETEIRYRVSFLGEGRTYFSRSYNGSVSKNQFVKMKRVN